MAGLKWIIVLVLITLSSKASFGQVKYEELKAAIIVQFAENINWPMEQDFIEFQIKFYGQNKAIYEVFKRNKALWKIKNLPINPSYSTDLNALEGVQILYVDRSTSIDLTQIVQKIRNKHILLITEQSLDTKNVMLNILYLENEKALSYEINKTNILLEGLTVDPELVLLRGAEIDVRELYNQIKIDLSKKEEEAKLQRQLLQSQKLQLVEQQKKNKTQKHQITIDELRIEALIKNTGTLNDQIDKRESMLSQLSNDIIRQQKELARQESKVSIHRNELSQYEDRINDQGEMILKRSAILDSLTQESQRQQQVIVEQGETLNAKEQALALQLKMIYLFILFLIVALSLSVLAYRQYRKRHKALESLKKSNQSLNEQHQYNLQLNEQLQVVNDKLENRVKDRTKILEMKNEQLTEYAFVNSHLLRAPLSRILGISNIMVQENISEANRDLMLAMQESANELDAIVRKINHLLDEEGTVNRTEVEKLIKRKILLEQQSEKSSSKK